MEKLIYIMLTPSKILGKVAMTSFLFWGQISWESYSMVIWITEDFFSSFFLNVSNCDTLYRKITWSLDII